MTQFARPRHTYIGGSDAAALLGKHAFKSPAEVYKKLTDGSNYEEKDLSGNRHIQRGNYIEPIAEARIEQDYPSLNGDNVERIFDRDEKTDQIYLEHPDLPYVAGHTDGISLDPFGDTAIVHEIKSPTSSSIEYIERHGIPNRYFYQIQHYMGIAAALTDEYDVTGKLQIWSCDDWDVRTFEIERRPQLFSKLTGIYEKVYEAAQSGVPFEECQVFNFVDVEDSESVYTSERMEDMLADYYEAYTTYKEMKSKKSDLKGKILSQLNGEERIEGDGHYATVKYYDNSTHLSVREYS